MLWTFADCHAIVRTDTTFGKGRLQFIRSGELPKQNEPKRAFLVMFEKPMNRPPVAPRAYIKIRKGLKSRGSHSRRTGAVARTR
jgi:hypothetical protein